jgi:signal transduction histidine kinase
MHPVFRGQFGMKLTIRRKIILAFAIFILINGLLWSLSYYSSYVINQKIQIIEEKSSLFNTVLEARRYEKNYFLYFDKKDIDEALSYTREAESKLEQITERFGKYTLTRNLSEKLQDLRTYEKNLAEIRSVYGEDGSLKIAPDSLEAVSDRQALIRDLGRRITEDLEKIVAEEHRRVYGLLKQSRIYHWVALAVIFVMSLSTVFFLLFNVHRPMLSIENAIQKIAEGNYSTIPRMATGDEFESLVTSLNAMIAELNRRSEQLVQAKKLASLGTLTSGVAHELNNPLNNISTSVQILLEELEEDDLEHKQELLQETERQVERARDIVKALLEFSREASFKVASVSFSHLVDSTLKLIKGDLPPNITVKVDVPEDIQVQADARRIEQALLNLFLNGIQAMENGGELTISGWKSKEDGMFYLEVRDTGDGIPPEDLSKIFDPFFTTKGVGKGTGLGLSVTHGIIEQHGGRITVKSEPGEGTVFTVNLPLGGEDAFR